jgi:2-methylisocitrate lyase-like PEP mutase family enzyme
MTRQARKAAAFPAPHAAEPFVMPNPSDPGTVLPLSVDLENGYGATTRPIGVSVGHAWR